MQEYGYTSLQNAAVLMQNWVILCPEEEEEEDLRHKAMLIKKEASQVLWLRWK
jgi:hypothetical protein